MSPCAHNLGHALAAGVVAAGTGLSAAPATAADFDFFGRSGDGITLDFGRLPGVNPGAAFTNLDLSAFGSHVGLTSDVLEGTAFAQTGRLFVFADNDRGPGRGGDTDPDAPGYQGTFAGSVDIDGVTHDFSVTVQPGYTGVGRGAVGQSLERLGGTSNNPLFVAQQQQRLAYLDFQRDGGGNPDITGTFDTATDEALRTFQAAFVGGLNTTQNSVDGIVGPTTAGWLNAGNAPRWERLLPNADISSVSSFEPYATSWAVELILAAATDAKAATGIDQRVTALSTFDGYGSSAIHSTHRAGMDIDLGIPLEARNLGNGSLNAGEADAADFARAFIDAHLHHDLDVRVSRLLTSNTDLLGAINGTHPGGATYDSSGGHDDHFHFDVTPLGQDAPAFNLAGDFNLDDVVNADDIDLLYRNLGGDPDTYSLVGRGTPVVDTFDLTHLVETILGTTFGDANLSGQVEQGDLDVVLQNWGQLGVGFAGGDVNGSGQVEQGDLDLVLQLWGQTGSPTFQDMSVPEPAAAAIMLLFGGVRRRLNRH